MGTCQFYFQHVKPFQLSKKKLSQFILNQLYQQTEKEYQISYLLTDDENVYRINLQYLNHDTYTDIITFDLSDPKNHFQTADIYISIDRVKENALNMQLSWKEELHRVIFHGALHLAGYQDKSTHDQSLMRQKENEWLEAYEHYKM